MSEHWIKLLIKFRGKCSVCGKEIPQGEYALWSKAAKAIKHIECESKPEVPATIELNCFICGKQAGCASCSFEADCNRAVVSQACICEQCLANKLAYENYQNAFLARMAKIKM